MSNSINKDEEKYLWMIVKVKRKTIIFEKHIEEQENETRTLKNNMIKELKIFNFLKSSIDYVKILSKIEDLKLGKIFESLKNIWKNTKKFIFRTKRKLKKKNYFYNFTKKRRFKKSQRHRKHETCYTIEDKRRLTQKEFEKRMVWIADTGASSHMTFLTKGFTDIQATFMKMNYAVEGQQQEVNFKGHWRGRPYHPDKERNKYFSKGNIIVLENVLKVPELRNNLYSVTQAMKKGAILSNEGEVLILTFPEGNELRFDYKLPTSQGYVMGALISPLGETEEEDITPILMNFNLFHKRLGHSSENYLRSTAKTLNIKLTGKLQPCIHCARANAQKKKINKTSDSANCKVGERIGVDITGFKRVSLGKKKYANVKIDYSTDYLFASFLKTKDEAIDDLKSFIKIIKKHKPMNKRYIRCDGSGENKKWISEYQKKNVDIIFEMTSKDTPQQNGKIERAIATIWSKVRAMMAEAGIKGAIKGRLLCEAFRTQFHSLFLLQGVYFHPKA